MTNAYTINTTLWIEFDIILFNLYQKKPTNLSYVRKTK